MERNQEFFDYKLLHDFQYEVPLKSWVNETNFINKFKEDWNVLMEVLDTIESFGYGVVIDGWSVSIPLANIRVKGSSRRDATYKACLEFLKER
ncbi:MAG: hypothetical protein AAGA43_13370 [Bacteroidota bacterium]